MNPRRHRRLAKDFKRAMEDAPPNIYIGLDHPENHKEISARNQLRDSVALAARRRFFTLLMGHNDPGSLLYRLDRGNMMLRIILSFVETSEHALQRYPPIAPKPENGLLRWAVAIVITDKPQSPYNNGVFALKMKFPSVYPFSPPKIKISTPVFHPLVYKLGPPHGGSLCLDLVDHKWSPALKPLTVILSVRDLLLRELTSDELFDHANADARRLYSNDRKKFNEIARSLTKEHARRDKLDLNLNSIISNNTEHGS